MNITNESPLVLIQAKAPRLTLVRASSMDRRLVASGVPRIRLEADRASGWRAWGGVEATLAEDGHEHRVPVALWLEEEAGVHADVCASVNEHQEAHPLLHS